jgi:hypothetical protein
MEHITNSLSEYRHPPKKSRPTERGDLFDTILSHLNPPRAQKKLRPVTHKRLGFQLAGIPTKDIYSLISKCDDAQRRGVAWSAAFWVEIRPQQQPS